MVDYTAVLCIRCVSVRSYFYCRETISVRLLIILFQLLLPFGVIYFAVDISSNARSLRENNEYLVYGDKLVQVTEEHFAIFY